MSEFEKEVRELFDLCYRVIEELPGVGISFDFSQNGLDIYVKKDESKIYSESEEEFEWDFHSSMFENLPQHSRKEYEKSKKYILELLRWEVPE